VSECKFDIYVKLIRQHVLKIFPALTLVALALALASCTSVKVLAPAPSAQITKDISSGILGNWEQLGIQKGQPVPDFTLFSENGKVFNLSSELKKGQPIVLISGSYTCDVSRRNMETIKALYKQFEGQARFFMVYTIDAHPFDTSSPYSAEGKVWIARSNVRDNIKAAQPQTYKERVGLAHKWMTENSIAFPVLVDGPDNFYWKKFGQAPNMVYIITPSQDVYYKQAWFNQEKLAIQLESLEGQLGQ
jgi:hypothetical protein